MLLLLAPLAVPGAPIALPIQENSNIHLATPTVRPFLPEVILNVEDAAVQVAFDTGPITLIISTPDKVSSVEPSLRLQEAKATDGVAKKLSIAETEVEPVVYELVYSSCYYSCLIREYGRPEVFVIAAFVLIVILVENYMKHSFFFYNKYGIRTFQICKD